jgi:hypothetical protein
MNNLDRQAGCLDLAPAPEQLVAEDAAANDFLPVNRSRQGGCHSASKEAGRRAESSIDLLRQHHRELKGQYSHQLCVKPRNSSGRNGLAPIAHIMTANRFLVVTAVISRNANTVQFSTGCNSKS